MIELHRLNGTEFFLNAELIKLIEQSPDTLITLAGPGTADGERIRVRETPREVVELVAQWRRRTGSASLDSSLGSSSNSFSESRSDGS